MYLNSLNHRITRLLELIKICEGNKNSYEKALETFKPPIFWKDKALVTQQINSWNKDKLESLLYESNKIELLIKKNSGVGKNILSDFIINNSKKINN